MEIGDSWARPCQAESKDLYDSRLKDCLLSGSRNVLVGEPLAMGTTLAGLLRSEVNESFGTIIEFLAHFTSFPNPTSLTQRWIHNMLYNWVSLLVTCHLRASLSIRKQTKSSVKEPFTFEWEILNYDAVLKSWCLYLYKMEVVISW